MANNSANIDDDKSHSHHGRMLSKLKCKSCQNLLFVPVRECSDCGNSLCPMCEATASRCPKCCAKFDHFRSITLNIFLQVHQISPCLNEQCFNLKKYLKILEDYSTTPKPERIECPLNFSEDCEFHAVNLPEAIWHCHQHHPRNIYFSHNKVLRCKNFRTNSAKLTDLCVIFVCHNEVFRLFSRVDYLTGVTKWQVFITGAIKLAKKFGYELTFAPKRVTKQKIVLASPCRRYYNDEGINWETDFLIVGYDMLKDLCVQRDLYCQVKIYPVDN